MKVRSKATPCVKICNAVPFRKMQEIGNICTDCSMIRKIQALSHESLDNIYPIKA